MSEILSFLTPEVLMSGFIIFMLRLIDMCLDTLRVLFVMRGQRLIVWILGVITSMIYIVAISNVLSGDNNFFTILCYATGYATGNILGMQIEEKLAIGFKSVNIISQTKGHEIAMALRSRGYGATEIKGEGMNGSVEPSNASRPVMFARSWKKLTKMHLSLKTTSTRSTPEPGGNNHRIVINQKRALVWCP